MAAAWSVVCCHVILDSVDVSVFGADRVAVWVCVHVAVLQVGGGCRDAPDLSNVALVVGEVYGGDTHVCLVVHPGKLLQGLLLVHLNLAIDVRSLGKSLSYGTM